MSETGVLSTIAQRVRARVAEARAAEPLAELEARLAGARPTFSLAERLRRPGVQVIAEVKLASPSEGRIAPPSTDPLAVAAGYLAQGAAALSILTEQDFFGGHLDTLARVRRAHPQALLLMKDFVVDEHQLVRGRLAGADAVLLIVALLGRERLAELLLRARALALSPLVEVHDAAELEVALGAGAELVGVNNRNLATLEVSLDTAAALASLAGPHTTRVAESGLRTAGDVLRMQALGYHGFLIGTHFMRQSDPGAALGRLLAGCAAEGQP